VSSGNVGRPTLCTEGASMGIRVGPWLAQVPVIWIHSYTHTQIYTHYNTLYMVCTDIFVNMTHLIFKVKLLSIQFSLFHTTLHSFNYPTKRNDIGNNIPYLSNAGLP